MLSRVVTRLLVPAAAIVAEQSNELICKPSELPIYSPNKPTEQKQPPRQEPNIVEQQIGKVRKQLVSLTDHVTTAQDMAEDAYNQAYEHAHWLIDYLSDEDTTTPKYGAIAVGGLAGYILALRGGFFRRVLFTSAGALGMAAVCYPKEAVEYSDLFKTEVKRYVRIGYNFYHGVKKDDPPLELPSLPKIPASFGEVWDLATGSATTKSDAPVLGDDKLQPEVNVGNPPEKEPVTK